MVRVLVFSAHLDDAVLSAGEFLAEYPGSYVATVLSAVPASSTRTVGDLSAGFTDSHQAMVARRLEDRAALSKLGSQAIHLDFYDEQYGAVGQESAMRRAIVGLLSEMNPALVVGPIGLVHRDHKLVARLVLEAAMNAALAEIYLYDDLPYRVVFRQASATDRENITSQYPLFPLRQIFTNAAAKRSALQEYRSQLGPFVNERSCMVTERFWVVRPTDDIG